jgi:hypothetical protein
MARAVLFRTRLYTMKRRIFLLIIICALAAVPVRATIPLVEELSLQLPPCTSWDVQHWMDTNTFGYAYLRADTVYWAAHVGDAVQTFAIPESLYITEPHDETYHIGVYVMRHPSVTINPCILL